MYKASDQFITSNNIVITVDEPEKAGIVQPTVTELKAVLDSIKHISLLAYVDTVSDKPLVSQVLTPGKVVDQHQRVDLDVTEWKLSNGIHVILKPTDFKNDEIEFVSYSSGGTSLVPDSDYIAAVTASSIVDQSGLADFDLITLGKKLTGKLANATPYIGEYDEGLSGSSSTKDVETMFQLVYLYFTAPRKDSSAFISYQSKMKAMLTNRSADP